MSRRLALLLLAVVALAGVPAVASAEAPVAHIAKSAPNVKCMRLDKAKRKLYMAGFNVRVRGGGLLGVVVESNWVVTSQSTRGRTVTVYAGRSC